MICVSELKFTELQNLLGLQKERSSDAVIVQAINQLTANHKWLCFHCGFGTSSPDEAAAHFGDGDDSEPLCIYWARLNEDEKLGQVQSYIQELNGERDNNHQLRSQIETLEYRIGSHESEINGYRPFRNCHNMHDIFNVYDSMEGRALAAEERLTKWEKIPAYLTDKAATSEEYMVLELAQEAMKDIIPGSLRPLADKIANLEDQLAQCRQAMAGAAYFIQDQKAQDLLQRETIAEMAPSLYHALESLQVVAEGLQTLSQKAQNSQSTHYICPGCKKAYDAIGDGCELCRTKRAEIRDLAKLQQAITSEE